MPFDVTAYDFQSWLKALHLARPVFYVLDNVPIVTRVVVTHRDLEWREWLSFIKLATVRDMGRLRAQAMSNGMKQYASIYSMVDLALIGRELGVGDGIIWAYEELRRCSPLLNAHERARLGITKSFKVIELRQRSMH